MRKMNFLLVALCMAIAAAAQTPPPTVPGDTVILAKLITALDLQQTTVGQQVEAQSYSRRKTGQRRIA